jgi:hypothetical protein
MSEKLGTECSEFELRGNFEYKGQKFELIHDFWRCPMEEANGAMNVQNLF